MNKEDLISKDGITLDKGIVFFLIEQFLKKEGIGKEFLDNYRNTMEKHYNFSLQKFSSNQD